MKKALLIFVLLFGFVFADEVACTTDYVPMCGTDGKVYSNKCNAQSQNASIAYPGECSTNKTALYTQVANVFDTFFNQNASSYTGVDKKIALLDGVVASLNQKKKTYEKNADKYEKINNIIDITDYYSLVLEATKTSFVATGTSIISGNFEDDVDTDVVALIVRNLRKVLGKKEHAGALMVAYNIIDQQTGTDFTNYYVWALVQEYYLNDNKVLTQGATVITPAFLKIQKKGDYFIPISYQFPGQQNYTGDVESIFTSKSQASFLKSDSKTYETMFGEMMNRVYISAKTFFGQ